MTEIRYPDLRISRSSEGSSCSLGYSCFGKSPGSAERGREGAMDVGVGERLATRSSPPLRRPVAVRTLP